MNLREIGFFSGLQFKCTVYHGEEIQAAWALDKWSHHIHNQEDRTMEARGCSVPFFQSYSPGSCWGNGASHSGQGFLHLLTQSRHAQWSISLLTLYSVKLTVTRSHYSASMRSAPTVTSTPVNNSALTQAQSYEACWLWTTETLKLSSNKPFLL